jgi:predicted methyltransferase
MTFRIRTIIAGMGLTLAMTTAALAAPAADFMEKLTSEARPLADRERDGARRPYQVINLLGVSEGMTVIDIGAADGWFTRVLSAAVGPGGKVIMQEGPRALEQEQGAGPKAVAAALGNVEVSFENLGDVGTSVADVAVTALNLHHANDERGIAAMKDLFKVLKPGGVAAVIDHVATADSPANTHRILPATVKGWIEAAGLVVEQESDILRTTADDHTLSAFAPELGRDTDQFLFVVRKLAL